MSGDKEDFFNGALKHCEAYVEDLLERREIVTQMGIDVAVKAYMDGYAAGMEAAKELMKEKLG